MTHGPPKGILDLTRSEDEAGCENLFTAIAHAQEQLHCFGHIHEGWGAEFVTWKNKFDETPTRSTAIFRCHEIESLQSLEPSEFDSKEEVAEN
jgi:hypothetical protein